MSNYDHKKVEAKWQKAWAKKKTFAAQVKSKKPSWYTLVEFPYPSGAGMHVGHVRSYTALDVVSRKRRMEGYNVLYPMGWDAFGLPTENYAIKTGISPQVATKKNTDNFRSQLQSLGFSFDWDREVNSTDPNYYKWTQWIFQQFFKAGLAYKTKMAINWCPKDKIGLANEEVVQGKCERCGAAVEQRQKEQWMLKITAYADKLLEGLKEVDYLPEIKAQQENWIGRSEGAEIDFGIKNKELGIRVFTTRPDTILGATYLVLAPEHELFRNKELGIKNKAEVDAYIADTKLKSDLERTENKIKTGVELKGIKAVNPATKEEIPVWVSDYVLSSYGTGAIMAVPQHDERDRAFAETFNLPIVDKPLVAFDEAVKLTGGTKTVKYKLRDWVFSRQRYWGEPIPLVYCSACAKASADKENAGWVCVPEKDLPVKLPKVEKYEPTDTGESPLSLMPKWVSVKCPQCKGLAQRETDTMPNWAGSSWYFLAYLMSKKAFKGKVSRAAWDKELAHFKQFMPVNWYNGGMEHVTLHLLYSRFWNQFLSDKGLVPTSEPYKKRTAHGMILAADGKKMSKSLGNVINPDDLVKEFGADALRLYELFIGPFDQAVQWDPRGILGCERFLGKVWRLGEAVSAAQKTSRKTEEKIERLLHKTIKKVGDDIEAANFNTAVSAMMIFINEVVSGDSQLSNEDWQKFLVILSPFAPHMTEELWAQTKAKGMACEQPWPTFDNSLLVEESFDLIVQINGKVRGKVSAPKGISQEQASELIKKQTEIAKWITGAPKKVIFVPDRLINLIF